MTYVNSTKASTIAKIWAREMSKNLKPSQVFRQVGYSIGDTINKMGAEYSKSRFTRTPVQPYARGNSLVDNVNDTSESVLKITEQDAISIVVDELDELQSSVELRNTISKDSLTDLSNHMDGYFNYEAANSAANVVNNDDFSGSTTGLPVQITGGNVFQAFSIGKRKLRRRAVSTNDLHFVSSPEFIQTIEEQNGARETQYGDKITRDGVTYSNTAFKQNGVTVYENLNYMVTEVLNLATNPTDGDSITFVLNNVFEDTPQTFTINFVDTIGTTPGNVHIESTVALTAANVVALLANLTNTTAGYVGFPRTSPVYWAARKITASYSSTNGTITFRKKGGDFDSVSDSLTAGADGFSATYRCRNLYMTDRNATACVVQKEPHLRAEEIQGQFGHRFKGYAMSGYKTFEEDAKRIVRFDIAY